VGIGFLRKHLCTSRIDGVVCNGEVGEGLLLGILAHYGLMSEWHACDMKLPRLDQGRHVRWHVVLAFLMRHCYPRSLCRKFLKGFMLATASAIDKVVALFGRQLLGFVTVSERTRFA
jgi:hypothetical protein